MCESKSLSATRSQKSRCYNYLPATGVLSITKGKRTTSYTVHEFRPDAGYGQGRAFQLMKEDGTSYNLFLGMSQFECDCPGKTYQATEKADRRHGEQSETLGCCHLDAIADLILAGNLPAPEVGSDAKPITSLARELASYGTDLDAGQMSDEEWELAFLDSIEPEPVGEPDCVREFYEGTMFTDDEFPF